MCSLAEHWVSDWMISCYCLIAISIIKLENWRCNDWGMGCWHVFSCMLPLWCWKTLDRMSPEILVLFDPQIFHQCWHICRRSEIYIYIKKKMELWQALTNWSLWTIGLHDGLLFEHILEKRWKWPHIQGLQTFPPLANVINKWISVTDFSYPSKSPSVLTMHGCQFICYH